MHVILPLLPFADQEHRKNIITKALEDLQKAKISRANQPYLFLFGKDIVDRIAETKGANCDARKLGRLTDLLGGVCAASAFASLCSFVDLNCVFILCSSGAFNIIDKKFKEQKQRQATNDDDDDDNNNSIQVLCFFFCISFH
jgi:hypothetical protein